MPAITQSLNERLNWGLHLAVWAGVILLNVAIFLPVYPFWMSLVRAFGNTLPLAILFYSNSYLVERFYERRQYLLFISINIALLLLIVFLRVNLNLLFPEIGEHFAIVNARQRWRVGAFITNAAVLGISVFYFILQKRYAVERRNREIINQQNEAQLQFLRAQINPHFLFNTLNNIYSLAVIGSEKTADMVLKLSNLLRYVIYDGKAETVALSREVAHIKSYIELFQMRSEHPADIRFSVNGALDGHEIEPMILIPLVENCFKHCDFESNPEAFIDLDLKVSGNEMHFSTLNTTDPGDQQKDQVGGVGLENIKQRLSLKYPNQHQLEIEEHEKRFAVKLKLQLS